MAEQGARPAWRGRLNGWLYGAEVRFDQARRRLRRRLRRIGPLEILPYRGHGTEQEVYLMGRVLEAKGIHRATRHDTLWRNFVHTVRRFASDEVPGVAVRARFYGDEQTVTTDEEGYFRFRLHPRQPVPTGAAWHDVPLELVDAPGGTSVTARGQVVIPPVDAAFGVVSDLDDTVLQTGATNLWRMARLTFFSNAHTRLPFEGVAAFYRALLAGPSGRGHNPIYYVSSSPWNLYDLLEDFLSVNGIPAGPLLLRDLGLEATHLLKSSHHVHKLTQIRGVLALYPKLPFILIGDSGQADPEIYRQVVEEHAGRILAVYIRDVATPERGAVVQALAQTVRGAGVPFLLVPDTEAAARHALAQGFVAPEALPEVRAAKAKDLKAPSEPARPPQAA